MDFTKFEEQARNALAQLNVQMDKNGISLPSHWSIDHLCYRVETSRAYIEKKEAFSQFGRLLIESEVNGRPISTFKLTTPIYFLDRKISLLELPAPKPNKPRPEGFEHIEVVCDRTFPELKNLFSDHKFEEKGLNKNFNPELEILLEGMSIKFHPLSLESVVTLESKKEVFSALQQSQILNHCRDFSPLIAGTFPLGIDTKDSDLDILLCHDDPAKVIKALKPLYEGYPSFESYRSHKNGTEYGVLRFQVSNVPLEVYVEKTETVRQRAYLHFQVEERLLKLGGDPFRSQVLRHRQNGMKTEPAFGAVLRLKGDPYMKLLEFHTYTERQLEKMVLESVVS